MMSSGNVTAGSEFGPWFYSRIWSGANDTAHKACNAYTLNIVSSRGTASRDCRYPINPPQYYAQCGNFAALSDPYGANDSLALLGRLASNIKGHSFNLAVSVGEFKETKNMVLGTLSTLTQAAIHIKRGNLSGAIRTIGRTVEGEVKHAAKRKMDAGDLAGAWLALTYGWTPLIKDVYSAVDAFHRTTSPPVSRKYSASLQRKSVGDSSTSPSNWTCSATRTYSQRYVVWITEQLSVPRSLGLLDPGIVVWELIPLSFVADWFIPIGSYLEARSVLNNVKMTKWILTTKESMQGSVSKILNTGIYCADGFQRENRRFRFVRQCGTTPLTIPGPRLQGLNSLKQLASSAALIYQRAGSLRNVLSSLNYR